MANKKAKRVKSAGSGKNRTRLSRIEYAQRAIPLSLAYFLITGFIQYFRLDSELEAAIPGIVISLGTITAGIVVLFFFLKWTHQRLCDIFPGHDMIMIWGGYILLAAVSKGIGILTSFVIPTDQFRKK